MQGVLQVCLNLLKTCERMLLQICLKEVVLYLLKSGTISANVQDNSGRTPLHICCALGHLTAARMLLAYDAHPNCKTVDGTRYDNVQQRAC